MVINNPVVTLRTLDNKLFGTGVFVSPNIILTCYHVVEKRRSMKAHIYFPKYKEVIINVQKIHSFHSLDIALLKCPEPFDWMPLSNIEPPIDQEVEILCPHEKKGPFIGVAKKTQCVPRDKLEEISFMVEGPILHPGSSGAPAVKDGQIVGLQYYGGLANRPSFKNSHKAYCIPSYKIYENIKDYLWTQTFMNLLDKGEVSK